MAMNQKHLPVGEEDRPAHLRIKEDLTVRTVDLQRSHKEKRPRVSYMKAIFTSDTHGLWLVEIPNRIDQTTDEEEGESQRKECIYSHSYAF